MGLDGLDNLPDVKVWDTLVLRLRDRRWDGRDLRFKPLDDGAYFTELKPPPVV